MASVLSALQDRLAHLQRRSPPLPVHVVEYHHHVVPYLQKYLHRSAGRRALRHLTPATPAILRFAAHPDLLFPKGFDTDRLLDRRYVDDIVNVDSWLMPLIYAGYVNDVVWVRPPWSDKIADGDYHFCVGRDTNGVKVDLANEYFVGECLWAPKELLHDQRECELSVGTTARFASAVEKTRLARICQTFILDIDLDFFSTQDPFADIFTQKQLRMIRELYNFEMPKSPDLLMECAQRRQDQLDDLESIVSAFLHQGLSADGIAYESITDAKRAELFAILIRDLERHPPRNAVLTPELIHEAGCMTDPRSAMPQHISSRQDIEALCLQVEKMLKDIGGRPKTVVISRSAIDNFTPSDDVQFIQDAVMEMLHRTYGKIAVDMDEDVHFRGSPVSSLDSDHSSSSDECADEEPKNSTPENTP